MRNFLGVGFCEKYIFIKKRIFHHKFPFFGKQFCQNRNLYFKRYKNRHNCPQYESRQVLKIFTLHILNIAKFG
jgi:hypothetical protein